MDCSMSEETMIQALKLYRVFMVWIVGFLFKTLSIS
jgi:hypothetical protein